MHFIRRLEAALGALLLALLVLPTGCATSLSTLTTAETTPPKEFEVHAGAGVYVPVGFLPDLFKASGALTDNLHIFSDAAQGKGTAPKWTEEQKQAAINLALGVGLETPSWVLEASVRYGLIESVDVGLRFTATAFHQQVGLDAKWRYWEWKHPIQNIKQAAAIQVRGSKIWLSNPALDVLDFIQLGDFTRYDLEANALYTLNLGDVFKFYGGLKYQLTYLQADDNLISLTNLGSDALDLPHVADDPNFTAQFFGSVVGVSVGYKYVAFMAELNTGYAYLRPELFGSKRHLGGVVLFPAIGIQGNIPWPGEPRTFTTGKSGIGAAKPTGKP